MKEKALSHEHVTAFSHEHMTKRHYFFRMLFKQTTWPPHAFLAVNDTNNFLEQNENQNTLRKTLSHVKLLKQFLTEGHQHSREIYLIPADELNGTKAG